VGEIMSGWIYQGGYPQLDVSAAPGGFQIRQRHFRFLGGGDQEWQIPALYRTAGDSGRMIVDESAFVPSGDDLVLFNDGGDGFYRVNYPAEMRARLAEGFGDLAPAERYTLLTDTWANVLAGVTPAAEFLSLLAALDEEHEPDVWGVAVAGLSELDRVISSDDRPALQSLVRVLLGDKIGELGWVPDPGETDQQRRLRALVLRTAGTLGDDVAVQREAQEVFAAVQDDPAATDGDVTDAAIGIVAANGGTAQFEKLLELRSRAQSPQDEVRYLRAAAAVPDRATAARLVQMVLAGEVRSQDSNWLLARLLGHRETGPAVWEMVKENWDDLLAAMPAQHKRRMLDLIMYRSEPEVAADIESWLSDHPFPASEQFTAQQLERLRVRVGLRERESSRLGDAIGRGNA
jgi:puromycin-sensitive aminopeptidase